MPPVASAAGGTHRSHAFRVQGDRAMLAQAVTLERAELVEGELRISVAPGRIGHAFPTGDIFRRLEVRVTPVNAAGRAVGAQSVMVLGRTFKSVRVGLDRLTRVQECDTRLHGPRTLTVAVPKTSRRVRWQIVWQRLPPSLATQLGMVMSDQEVVVLEGIATR